MLTPTYLNFPSIPLLDRCSRSFFVAAMGTSLKQNFHAIASEPCSAKQLHSSLAYISLRIPWRDPDILTIRSTPQIPTR